MHILIGFNLPNPFPWVSSPFSRSPLLYVHALFRTNLCRTLLQSSIGSEYREMAMQWQWHQNGCVDALTSIGFMFNTLVMRPCMIKKFGLLTFIWIEQNNSATRLFCTVLPLIKYLFLPPPPTQTCRDTVISLQLSKPTGQLLPSELSNTMVTDAFVIPAWPFL